MSSEFALSPPRKRPMELLRLVGWAVALAFLVWSWRGAEMRPMTLITESGNILTLIKDFFPPDFTDWRLYATEMVVTLQVAIWGTLLAVVCAVPLGILSVVRQNRWYGGLISVVSQLGRRFLNSLHHSRIFSGRFFAFLGVDRFEHLCHQLHLGARRD